MRHLLSFLFFSLIFFSVNAQKLSHQAEISIITCAPGNELYSAFGHSAMRVVDEKLHIDKVYNYGTFDFRTPNFYLKFSRGQLDYMLSVSSYRRFLRSYTAEKRQVKEQILNLNQAQKQAVFDYLENNAKPEHKFYRYDFIKDNCATRVKDVLKTALKDKLILGTSGLPDGTTARDMLHLYTTQKQWLQLGIDAVLGLPVDKAVTNEDAVFLPDYLYKVFENSEIKTTSGRQKIVKKSRVLFMPEKTVSKKSGTFNPLFLFIGLLFITIGLTAVELTADKNFHHFDYALFFLAGFVGLVLTIIWFATEHTPTVNNLDIMWAFPLHLAAVFMLVRRKHIKLLRYYFLISVGLNLLFLSLILFTPAGSNISLILFSLTLSVRAFMIWHKEKV